MYNRNKLSVIKKLIKETERAKKWAEHIQAIQWLGTSKESMSFNVIVDDIYNIGDVYEYRVIVYDNNTVEYIEIK